jgi:hypothetical protein
MRITYDIPHVFPRSFASGERNAVDDALASCVRTIAEDNAKANRPSISKGPDESQVTLDLPGLFTLESSPRLNALALQALMRCLCEMDIAFLASHPDIPPLYLSGVKYDRTFVWDTTPALYARRYGDCKTVTAVRVAELRRSGIPALPVFRWVPGDGKNGRPNDGMLHYHILVQSVPTAENPDGYEDPSKVLGMKVAGELSYFSPSQYR